MNPMKIDEERIEQIKLRLAQNAYFLNPHSDASVRDDVAFLLDQLEKKDRTINLLSSQVMELTQEIENVKSDFGGLSR